MSLPYPESSTLIDLAQTLRGQRISELDNKDFLLEAAGIKLDFSRNFLDRETLAQLLCLAVSAELGAARKSLFDGGSLNFTENRAVAHTLLRTSEPPPGLELEHSKISDCLHTMQDWVERIHDGSHTGHSGQAIKHVVNLGIGGSDLGPRMVCQALTAWHKEEVKVRFCANIDPAEFKAAVADLNPASTLFIICSKTLSTEETLANARAARAWLSEGGCAENDLHKHLLAVSTNLSAARELGIPADNILPMWDWVGGRYSLWSGIGWSIAFAVGFERFKELLEGAEAMDQHFASAPLEGNLPVIMSLLEIWYVNYFDASNYAIVPYAHNLRRLPAFLQQLTMESNGKRVNRDGQVVEYATAPVVWGDEGSNSQHSFHQLLHQGTLLCPLDIILQEVPATESDADTRENATRLLANGMAQAQALVDGRSLESAKQSLLDRGQNESEATRLAPHLTIPGNRPCNILSLEKLDPRTLGALLALYEHRTFCSGHLWQINSFDQYGVELGKVLSDDIYKQLIKNP
jgi:glucose-6-phosphate isomerase